MFRCWSVLILGGYVVRDTQWLYGSEDGLLPGLRSLSESVLVRRIQVREHSNVEDARATIELFLLYRETYGSDCDYAGEVLDLDETSAQIETGGGWTVLRAM
jgi:hypothetical protein